MSIIYKVAGVTLTNRVRLLDEGGSFVTAANRGELGSGGVEIDDPGSTLTITGWQTFTVDDDEAFPDNRIFTGYIAERPVGRGSRMRVGSDRTHSCTILDLNALLHVHVLHLNAAKRAAESDVARVAYLLTSEALASLVVDSGLVSTSGPINFLASDLRRSFADDVIGAMAPISAKNFFVYRDPTTGNASLYHDTYQAAVNSSALKISNVNADVDNVTTFAPSMDATDEIQPNEVYSGVSYGWQGAPLYVTSATTAAAFFAGINGRDVVYDTDRVGHLATAQSEAASYLNVHSTETHFLNVRVVLPSAKATQIKAGQRIQVKFSHLADFTSFTWVRIIRSGARPVAPQFWELALELWVPQVPVSDASVAAGTPVSTSGILWDHRSDTGDFPGPGKRGFSSVAWRIPWIRNGDPSGDPGGAHSHTPLTGLIEYQAWNGKFPAGSPVVPAAGPYTSGYTGSSGDNTNLGSGFRCLGGGTLDVSFTYDLNELPAGTATIEIRKNGTTVVATGSYVGPVLDATGTVSATGVAVVYGDVLACYAYTPSADGFSLGGTFASSFSVSGTLTVAVVTPVPATGQAVAETPGGTINAANTAFTTAGSFIELPTNTLRVFHDGLDQTDHVSAYDGVAGTFSLDYAPSYGSVIKVFYTSS